MHQGANFEVVKRGLPGGTPGEFHGRRAEIAATRLHGGPILSGQLRDADQYITAPRRNIQNPQRSPAGGCDLCLDDAAPYLLSRAAYSVRVAKSAQRVMVRR